MATTSEKLQIILELVTGQYRREAGQAAQATGQIAQAAEKAGLSTARLDQAMTTAGRAMVGFGAAAVGSLGLAAKAAIDWESAFAGVRKTVEASEPEFAALEQGLLDMSLVTPVAAEGLASIAEAAGQLGIKNENILDFTKTMAALGVTTNLTADEAASAFARIANILQVPQDQFDEMASTVVELGNKSEATESEIVEFATRIAGAGKIAGLSAAEVFAIGAAFSSVGIEAEAGGTAVQKVLLDMTESVATGSGNLETFARVSGVTAQEFITLWQDDSAEAFNLFVEGLGRAGDDAFAILQELGLEDQRLIRSFLSLAGAGELLRTELELGTDAYRVNTAATAEAEERYATVASELQILVNAIKVLAIEIGNTLLPAIRAGADVAKTLVKWFTDMPEPLRIAVVALTGLVGGFTLLAGAALIVIPKIAATARAIRDLRLAILALRAANIGGAIGGAAAGTGAGVGAAGAAAAGGAAAGLIVGAVALEKQARSMGTTLSGYPKLLYDIAAAAEWLGLKIRGATDEVDDLDVATDDLDAMAKNVGKGPSPQKIKETQDSWMNWLNAAKPPVMEVADAIVDDFVPATLEAVTGALAMRDANREAALSFRKDLTDAIGEVVTFFAGSVEEIKVTVEGLDVTLDTLEQQWEERSTQNERFWDGLAVLARAGLDDLVAEIQLQGPAAAGVVEGLVADMDRAFAWESRIEEQRRQAAAMANALANGLEGELDTVGAAFNRFGISLADQLEAGFSTADLGNTLTQLMDLADQAGVAPPGGRGRGRGGEQEFATGGVVSGPMGSPQLIMAHAGEVVLTRAQAARVPSFATGGVVGGSWSSQMTLANNQMMMPSTANWNVGGSRSATINIYESTGVTAMDLQYGALLANHMTLLD